MPFEQIGPERLTSVVNMRVTSEEKSELRHDAELAGLTVSQLVRRYTFGRRVESVATYTSINELRRISILLKQVCKDKAADPKLAEAAYNTVIDAINRLVR
jgi:hypothetical protein